MTLKVKCLVAFSLSTALVGGPAAGALPVPQCVILETCTVDTRPAQKPQTFNRDVSDASYIPLAVEMLSTNLVSN